MCKYLQSAVFLFGIGFAGSVIASGHPHWSYEGETAPQFWGKLDPSFNMCSTGKNQSPVDLQGFVESELVPLKMEYKASGNEIINNGHAIQVNYEPGSKMTAGDHSYELKQFHFHSPSENTINGKSFPLEAHFVHADGEGNLAVIAVMYEEGQASAELEKGWSKMPASAGAKESLATPFVDAAALMPADKDYYRFNGSLTTPPCSEGVLWIVMKKYGTVSKQQVEKFVATMKVPNNRPVQPLNARVVME
jgi:carbonic anhydrase